LGVVMYELLTGTKPFMGESEVAIYYQISHVDPAPLKNHRTDLPTSLEQITRKALEKDPLFSRFYTKRTTEVLRATQWYEYEAKSIIISEGEMDDSFFIIVAGKVLVIKNKSVWLF